MTRKLGRKLFGMSLRALGRSSEFLAYKPKTNNYLGS